MCFSSYIMKWIHLLWSDVYTELMGLGELPGLPREQTPSSVLVQGSEQECSSPQHYRRTARQQNPNDAWKISCDPDRAARTWNPPSEASRARSPNSPKAALQHSWGCQELGDAPQRLRDFLPFFPVFPTNALSAVPEALPPVGWAELCSQSFVNEQLHPN